VAPTPVLGFGNVPVLAGEVPETAAARSGIGGQAIYRGCGTGQHDWNSAQRFRALVKLIAGLADKAHSVPRVPIDGSGSG